MSCSGILLRCVLLFSPVAALSEVVRRATVESNGQVSGLSFWHQFRKELEAQKKKLGSEASDSEMDYARREILWRAVHTVDDKFHQQLACNIHEGVTYARTPALLQDQTIYIKANIASARECAMMCAADTVQELSGHGKRCNGFTFNKTSNECKFFNFVQQSNWVEDACCTSGPPCNLDSLREEIQKTFEVQIKRSMSSQHQLSNQLEEAKERLATHKKKVERLTRELGSVQPQLSKHQDKEDAKPTAGALASEVPFPVPVPLEKKPLSDRLSHRPSLNHETTPRFHWQAVICLILMMMLLVFASVWHFREYLVAPGPAKHTSPSTQVQNDYLVASPSASPRLAERRAKATARWAAYS